jgi:hypothetical protein
MSNVGRHKAIRWHTNILEMRMSEVCFLSNLSSSDYAAWAQAIVGTVAIAVGARVVALQATRARLDLSEREARSHDGLARLLVHLKDSALAAREEKRKMERFFPGHPAEPSALFQELADAINRYPLEAIQGEVPFEALLNARRVSREIALFISPEAELDFDPPHEAAFRECIGVLEQQILLLRVEAERLMSGQRPRHAAAAQNVAAN